MVCGTSILTPEGPQIPALYPGVRSPLCLMLKLLWGAWCLELPLRSRDQIRDGASLHDAASDLGFGDRMGPVSGGALGPLARTVLIDMKNRCQRAIGFGDQAGCEVLVPGLI